MTKNTKPPVKPALPSVNDVARAAGVAQATVSRAFTPGASISPAVKIRVMEVAEQLGYRPNLLARSLIMRQSRIIGVVMGDPRNPFYVAALACLSHRLAAAEFQMLVFVSDDATLSDIPIKDLLKYRVDALVLMSAHLSSDLATRCQAEGIPVLFFNRLSRDAIAIGSVTGANEEGGKQVAEHLLNQGYRRLAFMAGDCDSSTSHEREMAFKSELARMGAEQPHHVIGYFDRDGARVAMRELLASPNPPDAVFCANDVMAISALEVARHEFGLQIGKDVGIVGFDDIEMCSWPSFDLTSYSQPIKQMIDHVVSMILDIKCENSVIKGVLSKRNSTKR